MKLFDKILIVLLAAFLFGLPVYAQEAVYPERPRGYVSDFANIIDNDDELEMKLEAYENQTSNEISVATVESIGDVSIEEYAVTVFEKWGIGKEDKDNGILLLVSLDDKKMRIEVGYGLEGAVPDSVAGSIIRNEITPSFSEARYGEGIEKGVDALIASIGGEYEAEETDESGNSGGIIFFIILIIVVIFIIIVSRSSKGSGSYKSGKSNTARRSKFGGFTGGSSSGGSSSSGSSFGGYGGGRSGGGGASGSW